MNSVPEPAPGRLPQVRAPHLDRHGPTVPAGRHHGHGHGPHGQDTSGHDAHGHGAHGHDSPQHAAEPPAPHEHGVHEDALHEDGVHEHGSHEHGSDGHSHAAGSGRWAGILHELRPHSHDAAQSTDAALEGSSAGIRAVQVSFALLAVTAIAQAVVFVLSGSVALLADTVHNVSDGLTAVPLWLAFALGRRPPTRRYTYGLGRLEDLAGVAIVLMIAGSAVVALVESVHRLGHPAPIRHLAAVAIAGTVGFLGNEVVAGYRISVGRRIGSAALVADGQHARIDGITSLGVVLGALGAAVGWHRADPVVGILISGLIVVVLVGTVRDVGRRLLDGVDPELVSRSETALAGVVGVRAVDHVRLRWVGSRLRAEAVIRVAPGLSMIGAEEIAQAARAAVAAALPPRTEIGIHPRPALTSALPHDPAPEPAT